MQQIIRVRRISNPRTRRKSTRVSARRGRRKAARSRSRNPLRVLTLGASNPRSATVRRKRRKRTTASRTRRRRTALSAAPRRRRRNYRHRAANPRRRRRRNQTRIVIRRNRRRRNQFGGASGQVKAVFGGLLGVTGTKLIPGVLPGNLTATPIMASLTSVAAAWGVGELVKRMLGKELGEAYQFGGYMQAGSVVLNAFVPAIGGQIALRGVRGLGELVSAAFPIPQNPLNPMQANYPIYGQAGAAVGAGNGVTPNMNGLARAFPSSF